jgi:hypothetical protein
MVIMIQAILSIKIVIIWKVIENREVKLTMKFYYIDSIGKSNFTKNLLRNSIERSSNEGNINSAVISSTKSLTNEEIEANLDNRFDTELSNNFGTKLNEYVPKHTDYAKEEYPTLNSNYLNTESKKYGREEFESNSNFEYNNYTQGDYNSKLSMQSMEESNKSGSDNVNNSSTYEIKNTEEFNNSIYASEGYFSDGVDPK